MVVAIAVQLLKNYTAPYSDQVPHHPSFLSFKSLIDQTTFFFSPPISVFPSLSFIQVGRFFLSTISTLYDLLVFLPVPLIGWEVFH